MKQWHHKAIALKQGGASLAEISRICGFSTTAVRWATINVQSPKTAGQHISEAKRGKARPSQRKKMKETGGFRMGTFKRVAIAFTDEQFAFAANEADRLQTSFSKAVSDMVQGAMSKAKEGYRMKFGRFVKPPQPTTRKKPYVGSREWWNAEEE